MSAPHQESTEDRIFVGGSLVGKSLPQTIKTLLDHAMEHDVRFLVGDAPGVDTVVQGYLRDARYERVTVYWIRAARTNLGGWRTSIHYAPTGCSGSAYYAVKDRAMDAAATSGIMIWNGSSSGTRNNILA